MIVIVVAVDVSTLNSALVCPPLSISVVVDVGELVDISWLEEDVASLSLTVKLVDTDVSVLSSNIPVESDEVNNDVCIIDFVVASLPISVVLSRRESNDELSVLSLLSSALLLAVSLLVKIWLFDEDAAFIIVVYGAVVINDV